METYFEDIQDAHSKLSRDRVLADLHTLARDAKDLLEATAHDLSDKAKAARGRVTAALARARPTIAELEAQTVGFAKIAAHKADWAFRKHAYETVGVAFAIGLLIGALFMQRNQPKRES